jgi:hypothetical protein
MKHVIRQGVRFRAAAEEKMRDGPYQGVNEAIHVCSVCEWGRECD